MIKRLLEEERRQCNAGRAACRGGERRGVVDGRCLQRDASMPLIYMGGQSNMEGVPQQSGDAYQQIYGEPGLSLASLVEVLNRGNVTEIRSEILKVRGDEGDGTNTTVAELETDQLLEIKKHFNLNELNNVSVPNVFCSFLNQSNGLTAARELGNYTDNPCGYPWGPELMVGKTLKGVQGSEEYALIKVAVGGTQIYANWSKQWEEEHPGRQNFWTQMVKPRINAIDTTMHSKCKKRGDCKWSAIVWFQGENDVFVQENAVNYGSNLTRVMADLRNEMFETGQTFYETPQDIPVVIVGIGAWLAYWRDGAIILSAQQEFVRNDKRAAFVETHRDFSHFYHFESAAHLIIGHRVANALASLGVGSLPLAL